MTDYVHDDTIALEATTVLSGALGLTKRLAALHDALSDEAGAGADISDEAYERSGSGEAWDIAHLAQSVLGNYTGCSDLAPEQIHAELQRITDRLDGVMVTAFKELRP